MSAAILPFSRRTVSATVAAETVTGPATGPVADDLPTLPRGAMSPAQFEAWRQQVADDPERHAAAVRFFNAWPAVVGS